ncbi:interleukin-10 receptor subunit alpha isoform X2 [Syngnathus scovelli]|uniref:interleukin-10 receptor subunit alpha isoform X2 n=1 Tax=Syngnathus scovelli TaxID=161590 RepID=UPI00211042B3|nr:interleukin-10 receptor subunit alpha isoform X2 [Syngnathus scovelli]
MMTSVEVHGITMSNNRLVVALVLLSIINFVSGVGVPQVDALAVNVLDGEVVVLWKQPRNTTPDLKYNVQMAKLAGEWAMVLSCTNITNTYCHLSGLIHDYGAGYKVRVQTVDGANKSGWTVKKFLPNGSKLQPPSFTLYATSSTITVHVHQKPILRKLFPYGVTYIIHLEEKSRIDKVEAKEPIMAYLIDNENQGSKTFTHLRWGVEYCVSMMVEGNGALSKSDLSLEQCLLLPEQEWFIISVSSLTVLGVLAVAAILVVGLFCHLKRPAKMPAALKSPVRGWHPLTLGEGPIEVVTDKGWFLTSSRTEVKNFAEIPQNKGTLRVLRKQDDRASLDSGVSMECNATEKQDRSPQRRQDDSGCGSMGETVYPHQDDTMQTRWKESEVGLGLESSIVNTTGQDSGSQFDNYRKQSPALQSHLDERSKQILPSPVLADVIPGYRAGPQSCICSGADQCSWCLKRIVQEDTTIRKHKILLSKEDILNDTRTQSETTLGFPLLTSLTQGIDVNMNTVAICDLLDTD